MADRGIASLGLFQAEEDRPFFWQADRPAVLFVHGFMGSPAEMRPLGEVFNQAGWTAQGLLLPGFGSELDTLFERRYQDWIDATATALDALRASHQPLVLVGYSMGAAVALNVAAQYPLDGLILLAPFWRIGTPIQRFIWQVAKRLFRRPQPFKRANFSDPRLRRFVGGLLPELDLTDPEIQDNLRQLRVPSSFADQIFDVGKEAGKAAAKIGASTLIIQGMNDEAVRPEATRALLQVFPGLIQYYELAADHEFVRLDNPGYAELAALALRFAISLAP